MSQKSTVSDFKNFYALKIINNLIKIIAYKNNETALSDLIGIYFLKNLKKNYYSLYKYYIYNVPINNYKLLLFNNL